MDSLRERLYYNHMDKRSWLVFRHRHMSRATRIKQVALRPTRFFYGSDKGRKGILRLSKD